MLLLSENSLLWRRGHAAWFAELLAHRQAAAGYPFGKLIDAVVGRHFFLRCHSSNNRAGGAVHKALANNSECQLPDLIFSRFAGHQFSDDVHEEFEVGPEELINQVSAQIARFKNLSHH